MEAAPHAPSGLPSTQKRATVAMVVIAMGVCNRRAGADAGASPSRRARTGTTEPTFAGALAGTAMPSDCCEPSAKVAVELTATSCEAEEGTAPDAARSARSCTPTPPVLAASASPAMIGSATCTKTADR